MYPLAAFTRMHVNATVRGSINPSPARGLEAHLFRGPFVFEFDEAPLIRFIGNVDVSDIFVRFLYYGIYVNLEGLRRSFVLYGSLC